MEFKLAPEKRICSGSRIGSIEVAPRQLVKIFGNPGAGDLDRTSGEYCFESEDGMLVTLYDYKETNVYFYSKGLPSPKKFWATKTPQNFSIGGSVDMFTSRTNTKYAALFTEWLLRQL